MCTRRSVNDIVQKCGETEDQINSKQQALETLYSLNFKRLLLQTPAIGVPAQTSTKLSMRPANFSAYETSFLSHPWPKAKISGHDSVLPFEPIEGDICVGLRAYAGNQRGVILGLKRGAVRMPALDFRNPSPKIRTS